jgi:sigma-E factor negative regulatory protein RseB
MLDGTPETASCIGTRTARGGAFCRSMVAARSSAKALAFRESSRIDASCCSRRAATSGPLATALPSSAAELEPHYEIELGPTARVADRAAASRDQAARRVPLRLRAARSETAMPLNRTSSTGKAMSSRRFCSRTSSFPPTFPPRRSSLTIDTTGFGTQRATEAKPLAAEIPWRAAAPPGFKLSVATESQIAGSDTPVGHLVYSDGLATVSVFIEDPATEADVGEGFSTMGSTNVYSLTVSSGQKATAIGEVPRQTVRTIASSLVAK